jgi:hypothetical protein
VIVASFAGGSVDATMLRDIGQLCPVDQPMTNEKQGVLQPKTGASWF